MAIHSPELQLLDCKAVAAKSASPFTLALFKPVQRFFKSSSMEVSNVEDTTGEQSHFMGTCSKIFLILTGFFYITNKSSGGKHAHPFSIHIPQKHVPLNKE
jgi:hypothetical protein